jgi:TolA-binding protein
MKFVIILFALIIGGIIGSYTVLQNGSLLHYLDTHPNPGTVPTAEFYIGEVYYIWGDLQNSATYYLRITERYPKSSYADDAYYNYLQSIDDMNTPRKTMADLYGTYLERYPKGEHTDIVLRKIEYCRNAR